MAYKRVEVPAAELERQREICAKIREGLGGARPLAFVDTYGCQQNEADSEALRGYIELMGFGFTEDENEAELIVVNTCAVRGHAARSSTPRRRTRGSSSRSAAAWSSSRTWPRR